MNLNFGRFIQCIQNSEIQVFDNSKFQFNFNTLVNTIFLVVLLPAVSVVPKGKPLSVPLAHEHDVLNGLREVEVQRFWDVVAEDRADHGEHSTPEVRAWQ